jgi:hypothetical protein
MIVDNSGDLSKVSNSVARYMVWSLAQLEVVVPVSPVPQSPPYSPEFQTSDDEPCEAPVLEMKTVPIEEPKPLPKKVNEFRKLPYPGRLVVSHLDHDVTDVVLKYLRDPFPWLNKWEQSVYWRNEMDLEKEYNRVHFPPALDRQPKRKAKQAAKPKASKKFKPQIIDLTGDD